LTFFQLSSRIVKSHKIPILFGMDSAVSLIFCERISHELTYIYYRLSAVRKRYISVRNLIHALNGKKDQSG
jgi:hypothetical protein